MRQVLEPIVVTLTRERERALVAQPGPWSIKDPKYDWRTMPRKLTVGKKVNAQGRVVEQPE